VWAGARPPPRGPPPGPVSRPEPIARGSVAGERTKAGPSLGSGMSGLGPPLPGTSAGPATPAPFGDDLVPEGRRAHIADTTTHERVGAARRAWPHAPPGPRPAEFRFGGRPVGGKPDQARWGHAPGVSEQGILAGKVWSSWPPAPIRSGVPVNQRTRLAVGPRKAHIGTFSKGAPPNRSPLQVDRWKPEAPPARANRRRPLALFAPGPPGRESPSGQSGPRAKAARPRSKGPLGKRLTACRTVKAEAAIGPSAWLVPRRPPCLWRREGANGDRKARPWAVPRPPAFDQARFERYWSSRRKPRTRRPSTAESATGCWSRPTPRAEPVRFDRPGDANRDGFPGRWT